MHYKKIPGKRIFLSPLCEEDLEHLTRWWNTSDVTDKMGTTLLNCTPLSEKEWLSEVMKNQEHHYGIILPLDEGKDILIGAIGFNNYEKEYRRGEMGVFIGEPENRGKGYGEEAIRLFLSYAFGVLNIKNILINCFEFNTSALKLYKKIGFKQMGLRRSAYYLYGKYHNVIYLDILKEDFYNKID